MKESKYWGFVADNILSLITILIAIIVIVLGQIGLLPDKLIPTSILAVVTLLATSEIVESRKKLSKIQEELKSIKSVSHEISANMRQVEVDFNSLSSQIAATRVVDVETFVTYDEAHDYFAKITRGAISSIHQASIDSLRSRQSSERNPARMRYEEARKETILKGKVRYRYIGVLDKDSRRLEMSQEFILDKAIYNYLAVSDTRRSRRCKKGRTRTALGDSSVRRRASAPWEGTIPWARRISFLNKEPQGPARDDEQSRCTAAQPN